MNTEMISAHQRAIAVNHATWRFWLCSFTAGQFQRSIGSVILATNGFTDAMQKLSDALSQIGPIDDDENDINEHHR